VARIDPGTIGRSPISSDSAVLLRKTTLVVYEKIRTFQTEAPARELDIRYTNRRTQTYSAGNVINSLIRDRSNGFLRVNAFNGKMQRGTERRGDGNYSLESVQSKYDIPDYLQKVRPMVLSWCRNRCWITREKRGKSQQRKRECCKDGEVDNVLNV